MMATDISVYEEENQLTEKINEIMSEKTIALHKIKKLNRLRLTVSSPLCQSHINYYLHRLKSDILLYVGRVIGFLFVFFYLIFTLFRVYWLYYPEKNPFTTNIINVTLVDLIIYFYYVSSAALVIYVIYRLIRRFLRKK